MTRLKKICFILAASSLLTLSCNGESDSDFTETPDNADTDALLGSALIDFVPESVSKDEATAYESYEFSCDPDVMVDTADNAPIAVQNVCQTAPVLFKKAQTACSQTVCPDLGKDPKCGSLNSFSLGPVCNKAFADTATDHTASAENDVAEQSSDDKQDPSIVKKFYEDAIYVCHGTETYQSVSSQFKGRKCHMTSEEMKVFVETTCSKMCSPSKYSKCGVDSYELGRECLQAK